MELVVTEIVAQSQIESKITFWPRFQTKQRFEPSLTVLKASALTRDFALSSNQKSDHPSQGQASGCLNI